MSNRNRKAKARKTTVKSNVLNPKLAAQMASKVAGIVVTHNPDHGYSFTDEEVGLALNHIVKPLVKTLKEKDRLKVRMQFEKLRKHTEKVITELAGVDVSIIDPEPVLNTLGPEHKDLVVALGTIDLLDGMMLIA